jgi:anti-anti-sigma factor
MEIKNYTQDGHIIVGIDGSLDSNTVAAAEEKIMPLIDVKSCMILDLSKCNYVSSAGLRLLLMVTKQLAAKGGWLTLTGVCEEVKDVMEMTGFSCFFKAFKDIPAALEALKKGEGPTC